jgi:hypothetical protein
MADAAAGGLDDVRVRLQQQQQQHEHMWQKIWPGNAAAEKLEDAAC